MKDIFVSSFAIVSAEIIVKSTANRYLEKASIQVRTNLHTVDGNGPSISICIMSPGNDCNDESGCNGEVWYLLEFFQAVNESKNSS